MKKKKSKRRKAEAISIDRGTPQRRQHGPVIEETIADGEETTQNTTRYRAVETGDPLYMYRRNRVITVQQRDAGLIMREMWFRSGRQPRVIASYSDFVGSGSVADAMAAHSMDLDAKFDATFRKIGRIGSPEVFTVVCLQKFINRGTYEILRRGLDIAAEQLGVD